jgi:amidase
VKTEDIAFAGVLGQRELLRNGTLTARELVSLCLDRIEKQQTRLNAFVSTRPHAALAEADRAQEALDRGDTRPLLGIPFAVKDEHDLAGEVTALGTGATTVVATEDAVIVRVLRDAGAIPVGKTTLPELGMHPFTESVTWGITRNPWNPTRTCGGSSGGSAAAVAAGLVPFATAGDGGGSIRIPAACCGLFGLKMQRGRVPTAPHAESAGGLSVLGILARDVADTALLYDLLTGDSPRLRDAVGRTAPLRVGVTDRLGMRARVEPEVRDAVARVGDTLVACGHTVIETRIEPGAWLLPFTVLGTHVLADEARALESPRRLERRTRTALRTRALMGKRVVRWALERQRVTTDHVDRAFDTVDLVLTPTVTQPPVRAGRWTGRGAFRTARGVGAWCPYTSLWNLVGRPAASIPAGFTGDGLPIGAQLLAPDGGEQALVAVASQLEPALGWTTPRPPM